MDDVSSPASPELVQRLLDIVAKEGMVDRATLSLDAPLDSIGLVSADVVVILLAIEEEFGVYVPVDTGLADAKTLDDLVTALANHIASHQPAK